MSDQPSPNGRRRALVVTPDFPPAPGGIQVLVHRIAAQLESLESRVVTRSQPGDEQFDAAQSLKVRRISGPGLPSRSYIPWLNASALAEAYSFRPDITLSAHVLATPSAWALARFSGRPFVQYLYADEAVAHPVLTGFAVRRAAATIVVSRHTRELALRVGADPGRVHVIPPGIDPPPPAAAAREQRPTILTVARLKDHYKGHDVLVRALPLVRERVPDAVWVVVGDGPLRPQLERLAGEHGCREQIRFVGAVSDRERDAWFDRAHVFAMPSRLPRGAGGEGFGIVYIEANAHGLPVVAGGVGGALDAVLDGQTGLLVDPGDPHAVADAIASLLLDRDRAAALGAAGAARAQEFLWPNVARRVESLLLAVLDGAA